jgi:hypothetical protein
LHRKTIDLKLNCDSHFQRAFTACIWNFKVITLVWAKKVLTLKTHVAKAHWKRLLQLSFNILFPILHNCVIILLQCKPFHICLIITNDWTWSQKSQWWGLFLHSCVQYADFKFQEEFEFKKSQQSTLMANVLVSH